MVKKLLGRNHVSYGMALPLPPLGTGAMSEWFTRIMKIRSTIQCFFVSPENVMN